MQNRTTIQLSHNLRKELRILASKRDINYQDLLKDMIDIFKELDKNQTIISIPKKLADKIKNQIKDTDMKSVSEYTNFLLRLILSEHEKLINTYESKIKNKLKNLGYW